MIERLNATNLSDVARLYYEVYGRHQHADYWKIKYNSSWTGVSYIGYIAYDELHHPVAFFAVVPCFINTIAGPVLSAQAADGMTHPLHQKKRWFMQLVNSTVELCRQTGIRLLFGFPNQHSRYILVEKLGWHQQEVMQFFTSPVRTIPLGVLVKLPLLKNAVTFYRQLVLRRLLKKNAAGINNSVQNEGYDGLLRNDAYFANKCYNKTFVVGILDWNIWMKVEKQMIIGDVERGAAEFRNVYKQLKKLAAQLGIRQVIFQVTKNSILYKELLTVEKGNDGFAVIFFSLDQRIDINRIKFTFADIDIF